MPITTDLNVNPYFDDFSADKNFHRILFRPHMAVQARELTQLQTILQDQIEMFGDNILREGTIVTGGNFSEESKLSYVKLQDLSATGGSISVQSYVGMTAKGKSSGIEAYIVAGAFGLETQAPNLNTIWVKYTKSSIAADGVTDVKVFYDGEEIEIYTSTGTLVNTAIAAKSAATGFGYGVRCGEGIIYQKGHFIRFKDALTIISKYDTVPDGVVVGFQTNEAIIDSYADPTLLDNANSFNNYNAPGANRLQLVPELVVKTIAEGQADEHFFALQEYSNGKVVRRNLDTVYSKIGDMLAKRTSEESGNYVVSGFTLDVEESLVDPNNITLVVSQGTAYVEGFRVNTVGDIRVETSKGDANSNFQTEQNQIVSTSYGNYVVVEDMYGVFDFENIGEVQLYDALQTATSAPAASAGNQIGVARVRAVANHETGTYRLYLMNVNMNSGSTFQDVKSIANLNLGFANVVTAKFNDAGLARAIFATGRTNLKTYDYAETNYTYRTTFDFIVSSPTTIQMTVSGANEEFPYGAGPLTTDQLKDIILIDTATGAPLNMTGASAILSADGRTLNVVLGVATAATNVTAYFNVVKNGILPLGKVIQNRTVTINTGTHANGITGPYSLGMPDVYKLNSVMMNGVDVTSYFTLNTNQRDAYYDLSYVTMRGLTIAAGAVLTINVDVFTKQNTGAFQQTFFTVDSYPVDDVSATLTFGNIRTQDIPVYTSETGAVFSLRDSIDFRPYADTTWVSGTANPSDVAAFNAGNVYFTAPNSLLTTTYSYYLGRYDKLIIDQYGNFSVINGVSAENPVPPADHSKTMTLGTFYIPPYPALPSRVANKLGMPRNGVRVQRHNNKRYTMQDIRAIDTRIVNLEYYTSLNALETKTKDLFILDANGLDRFKNGIYVDAFRDLSGADITNNQFAAGIDFSEQTIHPKFRTYVLDLQVKSKTGLSDSGEALTLDYSEVVSIDQPYATAFKSCTTGLYNFSGQMFMFPEIDAAADVTRAPDVVLNIDLSTPFAEFTDALSQIIPLQRETVVQKSGEQRIALTSAEKADLAAQGITGMNFKRVSSTKTEVTNFAAGDGDINTESIGDFVTDIEMSPWLRAREVKVFVTGLRPNTRFYPYFDRRSITEFCAPAKKNSSITAASATSSNVVTESQISKSGTYGSTLRSDAAGNLFFVFNIPQEEFKVGDRLLEVFDAPTYSSKDSLTSYASKTYFGFNYSVSKTGVTASTRMPEFSSSRETIVTETVRYTHDPIIQSFIIDQDASDDSYSMVTGVDVYFGSKSDTVGISAMLREMNNGIPTAVNVPHSVVHLNTDDITVSDNGSVATRITFNSPVPLRTNTEYGLCLFPDGGNPDFKVAISRTGETDLITGLAVVHDTNSGMVFTSTNNRTWTPYQSENLKFKLYSAVFNSASGSAVLENKDQEYFTLSNVVGSFKAGEKVYVKKAAYNTGTLGLISGSTSLGGSSTLFGTELVANDWFIADVKDSNGYIQLLQVTDNGIQTATSVLLSEMPSVTATSVKWYVTTVGTVSEFYADANKLALRNSSAKSDRSLYFKPGDVIVGVETGTTATIASVDLQEISYIQPNVRRVETVNTRSKFYSKLSDGIKLNETYCPYNSTTFLRNTDSYLPSKSSVLAGYTAAEFRLDLETLLNATPIKTTPIIDYTASNVLAYEYIINNDATGETTNNGKALAKYVSKTAELADGMDATDLRVYMTAYRPTDTDVKVYAKLMSVSDGRLSSEVGWTELKIAPESDGYSSSGNRYDFKEFVFELPTVVSTAYDTASFDGNNFHYISSDDVIHDSFKKFAFKIVMLSSKHSVVPRVKDIRAIALS